MSRELDEEFAELSRRLDGEDRERLDQLADNFNSSITEKELVSSLESFSTPIVRIDRSYDIAEELGIDLDDEGEEFIEEYENQLSTFFDPEEGWLEDKFSNFDDEKLSRISKEVSQKALEAEEVADRYEEQIDSTLGDLGEGAEEYRETSFNNQAETATPEGEDNVSRRRILGGVAGLLGAGIIGYLIGENDDNGPADTGENLSMGERYELSEVEDCAAEYQIEQVNLYIEDEDLGTEDIEVEMTTDGRLEVYRREGSEQLYTTDSVASWTCELE